MKFDKKEIQRLMKFPRRAKNDAEHLLDFAEMLLRFVYEFPARVRPPFHIFCSLICRHRSAASTLRGQNL